MNIYFTNSRDKSYGERFKGTENKSRVGKGWEKGIKEGQTRFTRHPFKLFLFSNVEVSLSFKL